MHRYSVDIFSYSSHPGIMGSDRKQNIAESRGGGTGCPDPLENHKAIGILSNTGSDAMQNHKATMPAFNVGPSSARHQPAKETPFSLMGHL